MEKGDSLSSGYRPREEGIMALPKINWLKALPFGSNIRETIEDIRVIRESMKKKDKKTQNDARSG